MGWLCYISVIAAGYQISMLRSTIPRYSINRCAHPYSSKPLWWRPPCWLHPPAPHPQCHVDWRAEFTDDDWPKLLKRSSSATFTAFLETFTTHKRYIHSANSRFTITILTLYLVLFLYNSWLMSSVFQNLGSSNLASLGSITVTWNLLR